MLPILITTLLQVTHLLLQNVIEAKLQYQNKLPVYIIDMDNSGNHLYQFMFTKNHQQQQQQQQLTIIEKEELYCEDDKPLATYLNDNKTKEIGDPIIVLLEKLHHNKKWRGKLFVRDTAALRIIAKHNRNLQWTIELKLYNKLNKQYRKKKQFEYYMSYISLLGERSQAIYAWLGLNIITKKFPPIVSNQKTNNLIEIGGLSMQIAFQYLGTNIEMKRKLFQYQLISDKLINMYGKSYLGYGENYFIAHSFNIPVKCFYKICNHLEDYHHHHLQSQCVHQNLRQKITFGASIFEIKGKQFHHSHIPNQSSRMEYCIELAKQYIEGKIEPIIYDNNKNDFESFVLKTGLYHALQTYNVNIMDFTLYDIKNVAAKKACTKLANAGEYEPYYCMTLTYLYALLRYGFKFEDNQKFISYLKYNKKRFGWPLGMAYDAAYGYK